MPKRPNILFVMTDDQTVREMSCYGLSSILQTPNMDRIAAAGTRFDNCFCTNALCAPARATVLTGCFSHVNGITGNSEKTGEVETLHKDLPTFPELLQRAGYRTGMFGKYHIRQDPRGFDEWAIHPGQGRYFDPEYIVNGQLEQRKGYSSDLTTDMALGFLESCSAANPFCLVYQFKAPHRPFRPAPRHAEMFSDGSSPRQRAEFRRQLPEFASVMGWIGRSASVYRLLVRQRNPQRIEDFCLAGVGNRQPCDAGLLIHSIFQ